ncbi:hypothetical protein D3C73_924370 [compost metagenome]
MPIQLGAVELETEVAVEVRCTGADQIALIVIDTYGRPAGGVTREGQAIGAQHHVGGRRWWWDKRGDVGLHCRGIGTVALGHSQCCDRARCGFEFDGEVTVGIDHAGANHIACQADSHCGVRLTAPGQHVVVGIDCQVGDQSRW